MSDCKIPDVSIIERNFRQAGLLADIGDNTYSEHFISKLSALLQLCGLIIKEEKDFFVNDITLYDAVDTLLKEREAYQNLDWDILVFGLHGDAKVSVDMGIFKDFLLFFGTNAGKTQTVHSGDVSLLKLKEGIGIEKYAISRMGAEKILSMCNPLMHITHRMQYRENKDIMEIITSGDFRSLNSFLCLPPIVLN